jgi:AraC-like DNA-binding protein
MGHAQGLGAPRRGGLYEHIALRPAPLPDMSPDPVDLRAILPSVRLAPFVRVFEVVEAPAEARSARFPDSGLVLGFRYRGAAALLEGAAARPLPGAAVTGMRNTIRRIHTAAGGGIVVVKFREGEAAAFLDVPLHELFGKVAPLDALAPRAEVDRVLSRIAEATSDAERVAHLEVFLLARHRPREPDPVVGAALAAIQAGPGRIRIGELARSLRLGQDALEKRFRKVVGTSPKQMASLLRLRRAVEAHLRGAALSSVPYRSGYFDQSHFIREFRAATGEAPRRFFGGSELG